METYEGVSVFDTSADLFANSSTETVKSNLDATQNAESNVSQYDNVLLQSGDISIGMNASAISSAAQYVSEVCNSVSRVYCPFCPFEFNYEFVLKDHIKSSHPKELQEVTHSKITPFFACPFCHAKFYLKELLPRHIFRKHEDSLIGVFSTGTAEEYLQCNFCPHRVLRKHHKLIMIHMEKKHFTEFQKCVETKYPKTFMSCEDLTRQLESEPKVLTPGLSKKFENMHCDSPNTTKMRSILKSPTNSPCRADFSLDGDFNDMTRQIQLSNSVRRKLKFDIPDSPEENKENSFSELKLKFPEENSFSSKFKKLFKSKNNKEMKSPSPKSPKKEKLPTLFITSSPLQKDSPKNKNQKSYLKHDIDFKKEKDISKLTGYQFKCGLCSESYETNANLLNHLHKSHRGIQLRAQYRCGECQAKFYRNSYLVRHCWFHHTPKCLKGQNAKSF
ncbi:hypothetical protein M8J76_002811 [Diaphorina citri]|nr:hypothetical protein M8J76_002811 [Diaphorina citri]